MNGAKPITIRGVTYPSRNAAARALNVTPAAIILAKQRGYLQRVGIAPRGGKIKVRVKGKDFASKQEAMAHFKITYEKLERWIDEEVSDDT